MQLEPLKQWICDSCGDVIMRPDDGYVIWAHDSDLCNYGFKIIHNKAQCDNDHFSESLPLKSFLGLEGLNKLLSHLSLGVIKSNLGETSWNQIKDFDEYVDFFRRVQTPYYEEARTKFTNQDLLNNFSDSNEVAPYQIKDLKYIIETY